MKGGFKRQDIVLLWFEVSSYKKTKTLNLSLFAQSMTMPQIWDIMVEYVSILSFCDKKAMISDGKW